MEITDDSVREEVDSVLRALHIKEDFDIQQATKICTPERSMSFLSTGVLAYCVLCTLSNDVMCCVLKTKEKYFQISVYADKQYFLGTVLHCVLHETPSKLKLDVFDVFVLRGEHRRSLAFPLRFENLLECLHTSKKKCTNGSINVYDHKNAVLSTTVDIVNMFTDFSKIQQEYRDRLLRNKDVMGTIDCETGRFNFHYVTDND